MKFIREPAELKTLIRETRASGKSVGFVPTMGALHRGHSSLMKKAVSENDFVVVSIFVNPTQFGPDEDFDSYPREAEKDKDICAAEKVDLIFYPDEKIMYSDGDISRVTLPELTKTMCAKSRPGHFDGVSTVVSKLFNIVDPDTAYFGQKDFQQFRIIERMTSDLKFPVRIVMCPIIREEDGLALSSRNKYLDEKQRKEAANIYKVLEIVKDKILSGREKDPAELSGFMNRYIEDNIENGRIDYIGVFNSVSLEKAVSIDEDIVLAAAVWLGKARLIDNILVTERDIRYRTGDDK